MGSVALWVLRAQKASQEQDRAALGSTTQQGESEGVCRPCPGTLAGKVEALGTPGSSHTQQQQWGHQEELQGAAGLLSLGMCQLPLAAPAQTSSEGTDGTCFTDLAPGREGLGARLPANPAGNSTAPLGSLLGLPAWGPLQSASWDWTDDPATSHATQGILPTSAGPV